VNAATCPYCGGDIRFTAPPKMGEPVLCPVCKIAAVVVWLSPIVLEDASQMLAEVGRSAEYNRSKQRGRRHSGPELDEDRDDSGFGRKRRGFEDRGRRQGNRSGRYYED
jgi:lysine biosynthesis protein LysW